MSLFSLVAALLLEQLRPLPLGRLVLSPLRRLAAFLESRLNAGEYRHGMIAWALAVLPLVLLVAGIHFLLAAVTPLLAWAWDVLVLYLTMGFRQFSHYFTDIHLALRLGDIDQARRLLAEWRQADGERLSSGDVARLAIEQALAASHRHVFAVVLWFVLLGPAGAILYRLAAFLADYWRESADRSARDDFIADGASLGIVDGGAFSVFAQQAFVLIDWLPQRATAAAFAIVGDFEDAVYCWRTQASQWFAGGLGIVLASGAGALGVRLGMPIRDGLDIIDRPELGLGNDADVDFMQSTVGLVWRALVLWILLLLLLGLSGWVGG